MKKTYSELARLVRYLVAGVVSFIIAVPTLLSVTASV